jgi:hypothetical protein
MATEEFAGMPEQLKVLWYTHIKSYDAVMQELDKNKKEAKAEEEIKAKEVAVG